MTAGGIPLLPRRIRGRLFLLISVAILPMVLLQGWIYFERYRTRETLALQTETEVAQAVATTFAAYVADVRRLNGAVGEAIVTFDHYTQRKATRLLTFNKNQYHSIRSLSWVAPDGAVLASTDPDLVGQSFGERRYMREILGGKPWALGELTPEGKVVDKPTFGIATAVLEEGKLAGAVVAGIEPDDLDELTLTLTRPAGGAYAIFDRRGHVVFRSLKGPLSWEDRVRWKESDPLLRRALETGTPQGGRVRLAVPGGEWFSARVPIPGTEWVAGAGRPAPLALAPVQEKLRRDATLAALIAMAALLSAWLVSRTISRPLERLETHARGLGEGKPGTHVDRSAPEEVHRLGKTVEEMAQGLVTRAEDLRRSEERYRLVSLATSDVIWDWDLRTGELLWNRALEMVFGYSPEKISNRIDWWHEHLHPDDRERVTESLHAAIAGTGETWTQEYRFLNRNGTYALVLDRGHLQRDEGGKPLRMVGSMLDLTERYRREEEIRRLNAELERRVEKRTADLTAANRELEAFTYSVSHDLRAPLRHIVSFVELLDVSAGDTLDEKGRRYVRIISGAARRMGALIDDLLTFSRIGRADMNLVPVSLDVLVEESRQELEPETGGRTIEWRVGDLPTVQGDPGLLRTVVTNLLSNALKYSRHRDRAVIEIDGREEEGEFIFQIRDNGAGFDMRYADKLFGVFQRLHRAEEFEGTGIGLASVRRIVERHGGRVWAQGEVDGGATFFFALPRK